MMFVDLLCFRKRGNGNDRTALVFIDAARRVSIPRPTGEAERTQHFFELTVGNVGPFHNQTPRAGFFRECFKSRIFLMALRLTACRFGTRTRTVFAPFLGWRVASSSK